MDRRTDNQAALEVVRHAAMPMTGAAGDLDALIDMVGDARFVLLGEASHGTHEFYRTRAEITKRLITEKGFTAVTAEADWPDAYRVNCYVRGANDDRSSEEALGDFRRFPAWMWRNQDVVDFVHWLRDHNDNLPADGSKVGFYGLDLYSLNAAIDAVLGYLDSVDPEAAARARDRYGCFEFFSRDTDAYGYMTGTGVAEGCEDDVVKVLLDLQRQMAEYASRDGRVAEDEAFYAEQNARLVVNAEEYYRNMFRGRVSTWNLRDQHMVETLHALVDHLSRFGNRTKAVVWAHNSHLGDARATEMGNAGEWNVGQLVRQAHGRDAVLVGFSTHTGTVTAATDWGGTAEFKRVRPSLEGSYERLFHDVDVPRFVLNLRDNSEVAGVLRDPRLERAIGVIYRPESERISHYFHASLPEQFDAILHFDETRHVEPVELVAPLPERDMPETFPFPQDNPVLDEEPGNGQ